MLARHEAMSPEELIELDEHQVGDLLGDHVKVTPLPHPLPVCFKPALLKVDAMWISGL